MEKGEKGEKAEPIGGATEDAKICPFDDEGLCPET